MAKIRDSDVFGMLDLSDSEVEEWLDSDDESFEPDSDDSDLDPVRHPLQEQRFKFFYSPHQWNNVVCRIRPNTSIVDGSG
ncbi:hypothetical protein PoB_004335500 [Plakobranchus ocellatus]|uniref:Uncharacterized protein n=1 Tax=Plakobranchus ocellatus TaxID=259542 RepID=A0AAV4BBE2_9GAST|nr:hypothetical protein PoB_004335500 [Plakobranchus ocellatus]